MFGTFVMEFSVRGPTLTKNLLKLDANTLCHHHLTFSAIISCKVFLEVFFTFTICLIPSQFLHMLLTVH